MISLGKRGRGVDPAVLSWLMSTLQLGPGIGDVHYLVGVDTQYYSWLRDELKVHSSKIHHTLAAGEDALTAARNDVLLAYPGKYTQTTELAWDKAHTHLVGMGGPVQGHWRTSTESNMANVLFHTDTANVGAVINVTGAYSQFHNFQAHNEGDDADNLTAVIADKHGCYYSKVNFRGATSATAKDDVDCGSLQIDGAAHYNTFKDCVIGHNTYSGGTRDTAYSGHLVISEGYSQNLRFKDCQFYLRSETAEVGLVRFAQSVSADRTWLFEDCTFDNFYADHAGVLDAVFVYAPAVSPQTSNFILKDCVASGFGEWTVKNWGGAAASRQIRGSMAVPSKGGGLVISLETDNSGS